MNMHRRGMYRGLPAIAGLMVMTAAEATAAPVLRAQVTQRGDFQLIGNTLGHNCANGVPAPVVGTVGACGANVADTAMDVHWRADSPNDGEAAASVDIADADARSTAVLALPAGAEVTHAFLYWAASRDAEGDDDQVTLDRPDGFSADVDGTGSCVGNILNTYQCSADVTALVQEHGVGAYRVGGVDGEALTGELDQGSFAGWWMVVLYVDQDQPLRNLAVFDGFDLVGDNSSVDILLEGFKVPDGGIDGKLGLAVFEGDAGPGDQFFFGGGPALADANNPANNFFNSTRTRLGVPVSNVGDLPQLTGTANSMSGLDLDIVDITGKLTAGQTSAALTASTVGDQYYLSGFVTSIADLRPDFNQSVKTVVDLDGGDLLAGDELEYTIVVTNTGSDAAIEVVLRDPLPAGLTYVPGSLAVTAGANVGGKTDAAGDDQGEFDGDTNTVVVRLGDGADAVVGGGMAIDESTTVQLRVTVDAGSLGPIANQGLIAAAGLLGAPAFETPTGDGVGVGAPTVVLVDACATDEQCTDPQLPRCDIAGDPNVCVGCLDDGDCRGGVCEPATQACVCVPGDEVCDGVDNDCDDEVDEGCECGEDADCGGPDSGKVCDENVCIDGCHATGNGCPDGLMCTSDDGVGMCVPDGSSGTGGDSMTGGDVTGGDSATGGDTPTTGDAPTGSATGGSTGDTDTGSGSDSDSGGADSEGGCACDARDRGPGGGLLTLAAIGLMLGRRRR